DEATYGTFTVADDGTIGGTTGALVASGNAIDFDLTRLGAVTVDTGDLTTAQGAQQFVEVGDVCQVLLRGTDTVYLPAGTFSVTDAGSHVYGGLTVSPNNSGSLAVTGTTGATIATGNTIDIDLTKLAAVTVNAAELKTASGLQQVSGIVPIRWPASYD